MQLFDSTDTPDLRKGLWPAFAVLFFAASLSGSTAASAFSISDADFDDSDWTSSIFFQTGAGGLLNASQTVSTGNPAPAYDVELIIDPATPSVVGAFHRYEPSVYDPAIEGPLLGLDWAIESLNPGAIVVVAQVVRFAIEQNGQIFESSLFNLVNLATFKSFDLTGLDPSDFFTRSLVGPPLLDFSATAAPLSFGFTTVNDLLVGANRTTLGIHDNFSVSTVVPEPGTGILLTMGLGFLRATRRPVRVGHKARRTQDGPL